jgi:DNA-binding MarR family transcriptional regulator
VTLSDDLEDLAALVDDLESFHDVDVQDAQLLEHDDTRPLATLQVVVPERAETETPTGSMYPEESAPASSTDAPQPSNDVDESPEETDHDVQGTSDTPDTEDADHGGDHGGSPDVAATTRPTASDADLTELQQEVVDALVEHGEQPASQLQTVTGQNSGIYDRLDALIEKGLITKRKDPDDGRRSLYALEDQYQTDSDTSDDEHRIGDELDDVEDREASADGGAASVADTDVDLPDDVTVEDVHDAVEELGPKPYLGEVADEIGVDRDRARTIVFQLDRYSDCVDAAEYTGGSD